MSLSHYHPLIFAVMFISRINGQQMNTLPTDAEPAANAAALGDNQPESSSVNSEPGTNDIQPVDDISAGVDAAANPMNLDVPSKAMSMDPSMGDPDIGDVSMPNEMSNGAPPTVSAPGGVSQGSGTPGDVAQGGVAAGGVSKDGVAPSGDTQGGVAPGEVTQDGVTQGGVASGGVSQGGVAQGGVAPGGVAPGRVSQGGATQGGVTQGGVAPGSAAMTPPMQGGGVAVTPPVQGQPVAVPEAGGLFQIPDIPPLEDFTLPPTPSPPPTEATEKPPESDAADDAKTEKNGEKKNNTTPASEDKSSPASGEDSSSPPEPMWKQTWALLLISVGIATGLSALFCGSLWFFGCVGSRRRRGLENSETTPGEGFSTKVLSSDEDELSVVSVSESESENTSLGRTTMTFSGNSARSALNMN